MNRYPLWKYAVMAAALFWGLIYTLPNLFGTTPAVQISASRATVQMDSAVLQQAEAALAAAHLTADTINLDTTPMHQGIRIRLRDTDAQLRAKEILTTALNRDAANPDYTVALSLQSAQPKILDALGAHPMYLGLDLRGGVHFLLHVNKESALDKKLDATLTDARAWLRDHAIRLAIRRTAHTLVIRTDNEKTVHTAQALLARQFNELQWQGPVRTGDGRFQITGTLLPVVAQAVQQQAIQQNMTTLHNRINELGVAEPVVAQQGSNRIVVELPGVQDTAKAKEIIGRTATLQARLVDMDIPRFPGAQNPIPPGDELFTEGHGAPVLLKKQVIFTGEHIHNATAGFDENQNPVVKIQLGSAGGRALKQVSRENIGKLMAIVLFEKDKADVLTVATIQSELDTHFQITGSASTQAANDLALLLRAGSLAAPMEIIEERTIGPSLGADNIQKGINSVKYGLTAVAIFMVLYYQLFGVFSVIALSLNLLLLVAILSMLQATLTLPGIAAIALALGMAIDANVLINERIREERYLGAPPHTAISQGFSHAWHTILDSNVTTFIAGLALLALGPGPIRGFAVVHCVGIVTSIFSAVFFARGLVNLWYGRQRKLARLAIG